MLEHLKSQHHDGPFAESLPLDNFYQTSSFIPMSFALVTTLRETGETAIGPHALVYPFEIAERHSMLLISRSSSGTAQNIRRTGKCALNYIGFSKHDLETVSLLGYPGQTPEEKRKENTFHLSDGPPGEYAQDGPRPKIIEKAFQVFECTWDDSFDFHVTRKTGEETTAGFFVLKIDRILLKEHCKRMLDEGTGVPDMPIFYGFRSEGGFWFAEHKKPFSIPVPQTKETSFQTVHYTANRIDHDVRFTEEACKKLTGIPKPFLKKALKGIVEEAKKRNAELVDAALLDEINAGRK